MFAFAATFAIPWRFPTANGERRGEWGSLFNARRPVSYLCFPMFSIQISLLNVRRAVRHSPLAIRRAIRARHSPGSFAVAFQCPLTLSIDCHTYIHPSWLHKLSYSAFCAINVCVIGTQWILWFCFRGMPFMMHPVCILPVYILPVYILPVYILPVYILTINMHT